VVHLPRLYSIVDAGVLQSKDIDLEAFCGELRRAGVSLVQWRHKDGSPQEVLTGASVLRKTFGGQARLFMNDRADLTLLAGFGGVHVGQGDLSPEDARGIVGIDRLVGVSTHTEEQVRLADLSCADYVAIGPVFATGTKLNAAAVVGLEGVRRARALTSKPIVAIGGITRENARSVIDAGADSVAVISGLLSAEEPVKKVAEDFLALLR
jgi:thiamine-phosphate pyrophosphorylase